MTKSPWQTRMSLLMQLDASLKFTYPVTNDKFWEALEACFSMNILDMSSTFTEVGLTEEDHKTRGSGWSQGKTDAQVIKLREYLGKECKLSQKQN